MAWNIHFQCVFQSFNGTYYAVNICEQGYDSDPVLVTGAAEPFTTEEDDDNDIFLPVRTQSGYLRLIDMDGTLLEAIMPSNNTEKLVQLVTGDYDSGYFVQGGVSAIKWQGFLQAQAYTQPWDGNTTIVEFPVRSILGALEDIQIDTSVDGQTIRFARMLVNAFDSIAVTPQNLICSYDIADRAGILLLFVQQGIFFRSETVVDSYDIYDVRVGCSYLESLSAVAQLFGCQIREDNGNLVIAQYDEPDGNYIRATQYTWANVRTIASGYSVTEDPQRINPLDLLSNVDFRGNDNSVTFLPGGRSAKVSLRFDELTENIFTLPIASQIPDDPVTIQNVSNGIVKVQPNQRSNTSTEEFVYLAYNSDSDTPIDSAYAFCVALSVVNTPFVAADHPFVTGAFPARFMYQSNGDDTSKRLSNGVMINTRALFVPNGGTVVLPSNYGPVYSLTSSRSITKTSGYLRLQMSISSFIETRLAFPYDQSVSLEFGKNSELAYGRLITFYLSLQWGSYYWTGEQWSTTNSTFSVLVFNDQLVGNSKDLFGSDDAGLFIPIPNTSGSQHALSGTIKLSILNFAHCLQVPVAVGAADIECRFNSSIISELILSYRPPVLATASDSNENTYRQQISGSGFRDDKEILLSIGTINNNVESEAFIKQQSSYLLSYKETETYKTENGTYTQRPELHLLDRMVAHYAQVRRVFVGIVQQGLELMKTRYTYLGRTYFGVKRKTNWREDTEEVEFIEVT